MTICNKSYHDTREHETTSTSQSVLGIHTKLQSTIKDNPTDKRIKRRYQLQKTSKDLLPSHRITSCCHTIAPHANSVTIATNEHKQSATFKGLIRCESVWVCPVCSEIISNERRRELQAAIYTSGYHWLMATFTVSHKKTDSLKHVESLLQKSYHSFVAHRRYKKLKSDHEYVGYVKAYEITYTESNGWHSHYHVLMAFNMVISDDLRLEMLETLSDLWIERVKASGGYANEHGFNLIQAESPEAQEYIAKWGHVPDKSPHDGAVEITSKSKTSRTIHGRTPFGILSDYHDKPTDQDASLWREYAIATKGKAQLVYSRGFKDLLGMDDLKDSDLLQYHEDSHSEDRYELPKLSWRYIRDNNLQGDLLSVARYCNDKLFDDFMKQHDLIYRCINRDNEGIEFR